MAWLTWLVLAVVVAAVAALTGIQPKDARQVGGTRLMGVARAVLFLAVLVCLYFAFRTQSGF